jgi:hypothetical protein
MTIKLSAADLNIIYEAAKVEWMAKSNNAIPSHCYVLACMLQATSAHLKRLGHDVVFTVPQQRQHDTVDEID